jgi:hypothetical protein
MTRFIVEYNLPDNETRQWKLFDVLDQEKPSHPAVIKAAHEVAGPKASKLFVGLNRVGGVK